MIRIRFVARHVLAIADEEELQIVTAVASATSAAFVTYFPAYVFCVLCLRCVPLVAGTAVKPDEMSLDVVLEKCVQSCLPLSQLVPNIFVTLGRQGVVLARRDGVNLAFPTKRFPSVNNNYI